MAMTFSFPTVKSILTGDFPVVRIAGAVLMALILFACSPQATEQELLDRAGQAMAEGDVRTAEIDTRTALQQNPDNPQARQLLGEIYLQQQDPAAAVGEFERALDADVSDGANDELRVAYARALLASGERDRLLELDEQDDFASVSEHPRYLAVLARARAGAGDLVAARETLDAALAVASDDPYVTTTDAFFHLAYAEETEEARAILENTVEKHPEFVDAWGLLGGIQQMNGELAEAENSYAKVVELSPYRFADRLNLVTVRMDQGKMEEAQVQLQRLLSANPDHPGVNYLEGRRLVEAGDNAGALAALFKVLNVEPDHPGALYLAAVANMGEGNQATALSQLNRLTSVQPGHLRGRLLLSELHLRMNQPERAEEAARSVLAYDDQNYPAMALLARSLGAQGAEETGAEQESIELYQRMATVRPDAAAPRLALGASLLQQGDAAGGIEQFQEARDLAPDSNETWGRLIQAQLYTGNIDGAREEAEAFAEQQPDNPRPHIYLARIAQQTGDASVAREQFARAEEKLRSALASQPGDLALNGLLLNALMGQGKLEEADTVLAELPEEAAQRPAVLVARGRIALATDRPADAESLLRNALEENPDSMTVLWLSGAISAQGRDDETIELLNDWLADNPADAMVRNELASTYLKLGREQEARTAYQQVVESAPDNVIVLNNLAWLLREENPDQALTYIERAGELVPGNPQIMDTHAMVQLARGATQEALELNQNALDLVPGNPEIRYHRAQILQADGQDEEAVRVLESLLDEGNVSESLGQEVRALLAELEG